jgi:tetratricopeptide (TPR) repeat protein
MNIPSRRICAAALWVMIGACCAAQVQAQAQTLPTSDYDLQIQQGTAQLQAGDAGAALAAGDAAIRMAPDRWDGYALAGRALSSQKHYEEAADALSKAIDRAPPQQQPALRDLRRQTLLAESGVESGAAPAAVVAPPVAPPVPAIPAAVQPSAAASRSASRRRQQLFADESLVWLDASDGLMWARPWGYPPGTRSPWTFQGAESFCSSLRMLGHSDWRLPTLEEAQRVYLVSSKRWQWSSPQFEPAYGLNEALKRGIWKPAPINAAGDTFNGNRLLLWTSSPGDAAGEHAALYFGRRYSVKDDSKSGTSLAGESRRNPFQAYALCVRPAQ